MYRKRVHWETYLPRPTGINITHYVSASPATAAPSVVAEDSLSDSDSSAVATPPLTSNWPRVSGSPKDRPAQDPGMTYTYAWNPTPYRLQTASKPSSRLHPSLSYKQRHIPLLWDMTEEPTPQSVRAVGGDALDWRYLSTPATEPQCRFMRIHCLGFNCWYPLEFGSQDKLQWPITISALDALIAIYKYLQMPVTPIEYERLSTIPGLQQHVVKAFYSRCARRPMARLELSQGLKRVDCLLGNTVFLGLTLESSDPITGHWQLRVGYSDHWASVTA